MPYMTTEQIRKLTGAQLSRMSASELYQVGRIVQKSANASYDWLKSGSRAVHPGTKTPYSPGSTFATEALDRSGGRISLRGKKGDRNALLKEVARGIEYMKSKTGTATGYHDYVKQISKRLGDRGTEYESLTEMEKREYWRIVKMLEDKAVIQNIGSNEAQQMVFELFIDKAGEAEITATFLAYIEETRKTRPNRSLFAGGGQPLDKEGLERARKDYAMHGPFQPTDDGLKWLQKIRKRE